MPERLGWLTDAIVAVAAVGGAIWARIRFVSKSEIYDKSGRAIYQYRQDCVVMQGACIKQNCIKFDEIKETQKRQGEKLDALIKSNAEIAQWIKDRGPN